MLNDQCARRSVFVSNDVRFLFTFFVHGGHRSADDENPGHALPGTLLFGVNQQTEISGLGEQPVLSWLDGLDETLSRKRVAVQNAEAAAVQSERARVTQP